MEFKELKKIPIKIYLSDRHCFPARDRRWYGMYYSPLREERTPSFKVDFNKNLWYDFGIGEGGTIIDLVMKLNNCNFKDAVSILKRNKDMIYSIDDHIRTDPKIKYPELISIVDEKPLINKSLIYYLYTRKINVGTAKRHCSEVYYKINDKIYYAIGFKNDSGGYELRNKHFKGSTSKDITSIIREGGSCALFEGFMDYLSYLTYHNLKYENQSIIVLNSINNFSKAISSLLQFDALSVYFDNDKGGKIALKNINELGIKSYDKSYIYYPCKDFNEYLVKKSNNDCFKN